MKEQRQMMNEVRARAGGIPKDHVPNNPFTKDFIGTDAMLQKGTGTSGA